MKEQNNLQTKKESIFLVDDEVEICHFFKLGIETEDLDVHVFTNPEEAIAQAYTIQPKIIFVDYRMRGITGDKVAEKMPPHIPKCLMTGDYDVQSSYLFNREIQKPYKLKDVKSFISSVLNDKKD